MRSVKLVVSGLILSCMCGCSIARYAPPEIGEPLMQNYLKTIDVVCGGAKSPNGYGRSHGEGAIFCAPFLAFALVDGTILLGENMIENVISINSGYRRSSINPAFPGSGVNIYP